MPARQARTNETRVVAICVAVFTITGLPAVAQSNDLSELYLKLKPSVVTIKARVDGARGGSLGSGVIVDKQGRIITAAHVVHASSQIEVKFASGEIIDADVLISNPTADVALLKLKHLPADLVPARLGDSDSVKIGSQVLIIGAPFGLNHSLSVGYVSGRIDQDRVAGGELLDVIQTDAAVNQGNSGGPMFDARGAVVGIVSSIWTRGGGFDGIGFAIAINPARKMLLDNPSSWTGFDAIFLGREFAEVLNVPTGAGILVQHVLAESMAGRAGLRGGTVAAKLFDREVFLGGDIIVSIHGTSCDEPHDFARIQDELSRLKEGDQFEIKVLRNGQIVSLYGSVRHTDLTPNL